MADLRTLSLYLPHHTTVEAPGLGRGLLHGLPSHHIGDGGQLASVRFDREGSDFPDWYELERVKPVLYSSDDKDELLKPFIYNGLSFSAYQLTAKKLEQMAAIVDYCRALGIALNLSPDQYIRKELK
ncbi:hypothetical protein [Hymenobacter properus]|uniref:Uncharacterized protein n=1 Tax=Hymenobacter properus TaxID=2791026 RepID=A0A931FH95_9BACT|nr:hypothetical protein [Hymenobacter properus]MBF9140817.1 hypothetical protein [Hymenobacter properus]MBR7719626.1 hypothetical protein [Microvirga sp. SRT04]